LRLCAPVAREFRAKTAKDRKERKAVVLSPLFIEDLHEEKSEDDRFAFLGGLCAKFSALRLGIF
jgi:hypothetical protein